MKNKAPCLGNYVEDPKLRRRVGPVSGIACTSDDNLQREARVLPSKMQLHIRMSN